MASQTQASFGKVLDALAMICKALEDMEERNKMIVEQNKTIIDSLNWIEHNGGHGSQARRP